MSINVPLGDTPEDYRRVAQEARHWAFESRNPYERVRLLDFAARCRRLAEQAAPGGGPASG